VEKGSTKGWSFTIYEEAWNSGFHGEMAHFVDCVQSDRTPLLTGDDGRVVLQAIFAAYESARRGRKVTLPFASAPPGPGVRHAASLGRGVNRDSTAPGASSPRATW